MDILWKLMMLALGFVLLVKGADWFVDGAAGIANKFKIPQLIIGLTIVAMGTSAPEAAVSISAALKGSAEITIGNIVGSNILNILIILGLTAVITPVAVAKSTIRVDIPFMLGISALLLIQGLDGSVTLLDGIVLLVVFAGYLTYLVVNARKNPEQLEEEQIKNQSIWMCLLWTAVGLVAIILGSNFSVDAASNIARILGLSERFIGLTIVALGTSLPELVSSVMAARKGNADIAIGNIVGCNIFNILFVVGLSSVIVSVPFASAFIVDMIVAIGAGVLLWIFSLHKKKLIPIHGVVFLLAYAGYFAYLMMK